MGRGRGSSKTPDVLVKLLKDAVSRKSQSAVSRETGIGLAVINRYVRGIGEPTSKNLKILSDYFDVPVFELRGEKDTLDDRHISKNRLLELVYFTFEDLLERHLDKALALTLDESNRDFIEAAYDIASLTSGWYQELSRPSNRQLEDKARAVIEKFHKDVSRIPDVPFQRLVDFSFTL